LPVVLWWVASGFRRKSASVVPGFMIRLGRGADNFGLPAGWPGAVVHGAPDTALQNDQICASQRAKPGGGDLRQLGGSASLLLPQGPITFGDLSGEVTGLG
jgi:hypothetical protein